jgi:hypothetical protein
VEKVDGFNWFAYHTRLLKIKDMRGKVKVKVKVKVRLSLCFN